MIFVGKNLFVDMFRYFKGIPGKDAHWPENTECMRIAAIHYELGVIYLAQVDCITLLRRRLYYTITSIMRSLHQKDINKVK